MRTIAVGEDASGKPYVASSNGLDAGQRAMAQELGLTIVKSAAGRHAEENLLDSVPDLIRVGTDKRYPCGSAEHNCLQQLRDRGIIIDNDYHT
jgi:hypothetical protein